MSDDIDEHYKSFIDAAVHGQGFMKDGKHIPHDKIFKPDECRKAFEEFVRGQNGNVEMVDQYNPFAWAAFKSGWECCNMKRESGEHYRCKICGGNRRNSLVGGVLADAPPCQHYNMTVNGKCNDCGHVLTDEEREFYER